ncbi:MAG TPA: Mur ligase domain-containing protein [Candidatus Saccharimonadales bacterium]|nr:Mur ligase domain-containing protein [Candidatus Saccharimonadales bacterium]
MHIYFSGIGGGGVGPLAMIAKQAGYEVSGSDKQDSDYIKLLKKEGINLHIGQTEEAMAEVHQEKPIDWFVYSSALTRENSQHPELLFAKRNRIKSSLRDELLNEIISAQNLKLLGIAGTHGKSTTTAMTIWLFHCLGIPIGHSVGAKIPFGPMGQLQEGSEYFVYECDEFDYNFMAFHPYIAAITGIGWDHHEIFPTEDSFKTAFRDFIHQSQHTIMWQQDATLIGLNASDTVTVKDELDPAINERITIPGEFNRRDAWLAVLAVNKATNTPIDVLIEHINKFPGLKQRMELLKPSLYTNYAHTAEKLRGGMSAALELAKANNQDVVVVYEPLTNRRQHHIKETYTDVFDGAKKLYWVRSYLAREDPNLPILTPAQLIAYLDKPEIAEPAEIDSALATAIKKHLDAGDMVVAMGASGGGSLDEWLRKQIEEGKV